MKKTIFFWSPMLSHVGTISAVYSMAKSLKDYGDFQIYLINIFGEFQNFNDNEIKKINIFGDLNSLPKTGIASKISIYIFTILAIPLLIFWIIKKRPFLIISNLVGYIPNLLSFFFQFKVINSIQGYPRFNFIRSFVWKIFYRRSYHLITMTNLTKSLIEKKFNINKSRITTMENPIISKKIRSLSNQEIDDKEKFIFTNDVYCSIGRLTRQKNFIELLEGFHKFNKDKQKKINLIIIGDGEEKNNLENYIKKNKIQNCYLLGFKDNPFKYLKRSKLYISTSLWEDPGHTLIEAGYLNVPIISSGCPNGPKEIIKDHINGLKYELSDSDDLANKFKKFNNLTDKDIFKLKKNFKRDIVHKYTKHRFAKKFMKIIN